MRDRGGVPHTGAMPSSSQWLAFLVASILFIQVPGPSLLFTIGRALTVGRREALLSVVGNALGLTAQVALVALGLGAVVAASATAYTAIKLLGAAYVALTSWRGQSAAHEAETKSDPHAPFTLIDGGRSKRGGNGSGKSGRGRGSHGSVMERFEERWRRRREQNGF